MEPLLRLPEPLFYMIFVIIGLWMLAFVQRMKAAAINDRSHTFPANRTVVRRFGMGPWNRYLYLGPNGWERIIGYDYQIKDYKTDNRDRTARIEMEIIARERRWRYLFFPLVGIVLEIVVVRLLILPAPLASLIHPLDAGNDLKLLNNAYSNILLLVRHLAVNESWGWLVAIVVGLVVAIVPLMIAGRLLANFQTVFSLIGLECLYLIGYQKMQGAKVFDAVPGRRQQSSSTVSQLWQMFKIWVEEKLAQWHAAKDSKQHSETDNPPQPTPDPLAEAFGFFGLPDTALKKEVTEKFRQIAQQCHPDRHGTTPHAAKVLQDYLAQASANRDIIFEAKGW